MSSAVQEPTLGTSFKEPRSPSSSSQPSAPASRLPTSASKPSAAFASDTLSTSPSSSSTSSASSSPAGTLLSVTPARSASNLSSNALAELIDHVRSMPRPCQVLALLLPVLYAASLFFPVRARPFIALVPAYTMGPHYYLWTILLSGFYEYSLASLLLSVAVILTAGVKLCQAWTSKVFVGYLLAVNAVCSVACLCWSLAAYAASLDVQLLYDTFWCGFGGGAAAIAVALHAVKPNSYVLELPFLHVRTQQLPLFIFLYHMLGYGVRVEAHSFAYTAVGAYCSWLYLRFLRRSSTKDPNALPLHRAGSPPSRSVSIGDPRPDMSLAAFFPAPLQFLVARLGALCSTLLKPVCGSLRYAGVIGVPPEPFTPAAWTVNRQSNSSSPTGAPSAGGSASSVTLSPDVHDAARRRERARKALDQRLAQAGVTRSSLGSSGSITDSSTAATMTNNSGGGGGGSSSSSSSSKGNTATTTTSTTATLVVSG